MQSELKSIQREIGTTFVYVTHDQEEALAMSDRIAVMNDGRVEQIGSPREIYNHPATPFVADLIGSLNAIELVVAERVGNLAIGRYGDGQRIVVAAGAAVSAGDAIRVAVRPERVRIDCVDGAAPEEGSRLVGHVTGVVYLGMFTQFQVETPAGTILSHRLADEDLAAYTVGAAVILSWPPDQTAVLAGRPPV